MKVMRKNNQQSLKDVINLMLDTYQLRTKVNEAKVVAAWPRMMGGAIANRTDFVGVRRGILYLKINSAPLRQELFYAKEKIVELMNEEVGEEFIKEVVFR